MIFFLYLLLFFFFFYFQFMFLFYVWPSDDGVLSIWTMMFSNDLYIAHIS